MSNAPIALFVYNRLSHTQRTVESIKRNCLSEQSDLIVFSDSYKNEDNIENVKAVRKYIRSLTGFKTINLIERPFNLGLANSIISGINQVLDSYDRLIVLEDDLITAPYFLQFMNDALIFYRDDERVASVNGYIYPIKKSLPETFFLKCADCWGWGTWKRSWNLFEPDGSVLLKKLDASGLVKKFNFNGEYDFRSMLEGQVNGINNSWAIRWYASTFLANKLSLYPSESLVLNIGNDSSGVHCGTSNTYDSILSKRRINVCQIPVSENIFVLKQFAKFFKSLRKVSLIQRLKKFALKILKKVGFYD